MALPPLEATNQPLKVYPDLVGVPGEELIDAPVDVDPEEIELPPCASYVTAKVLAVQTAVNVTLDAPMV